MKARRFENDVSRIGPALCWMDEHSCLRHRRQPSRTLLQWAAPPRGDGAGPSRPVDRDGHARRRPLYNADVETHGDPPAVAALRAAVRDAEAILIASRSTTTGSLACSRTRSIGSRARPTRTPRSAESRVAIMGAEPRAGAARCACSSSCGRRSSRVETYAMPKPEMAVPFAKDKFDATGTADGREDPRAPEGIPRRRFSTGSGASSDRRRRGRAARSPRA